MVDRGRARRRHQQGVAIAFRRVSRSSADVAAGPGTVVDGDRLAPFFVELLPDDAGEDIGGAASRKVDDDFDRRFGIVADRIGGGSATSRSGDAGQCQSWEKTLGHRITWFITMKRDHTGSAPDQSMKLMMCLKPLVQAILMKMTGKIRRNTA